MRSATDIARGSVRAGFGRSPAAKAITEKPRYAKKVNATEAMIFVSDGQPEGERSEGSSCASVATEKTANTASRTQTMNDCALATIPAPSRLTTAIPTSAIEARMLSQYLAASSPKKSELP